MHKLLTWHGGKMKFKYIERALEMVYGATLIEYEDGVLGRAESLTFFITHDLYLTISVNDIVFRNVQFKSVFECVRYLIRNSTEIYREALRNVNHV